MVMLEFTRRRGEWCRWRFFWRRVAAGVSYLCQGSGCAWASGCKRRESTSDDHDSLLLIIFTLISVTLSLIFSFFSSNLFIRAFPCVAVPLLFESWKERGKESARGKDHESEGGWGWGELALGQIGSQLSVRPFITYLWLCAHLRCRANIQNFYYYFAYCHGHCYHNSYWLMFLLMLQ